MAKQVLVFTETFFGGMHAPNMANNSFLPAQLILAH